MAEKSVRSKQYIVNHADFPNIFHVAQRRLSQFWWIKSIVFISRYHQWL